MRFSNIPSLLFFQVSLTLSNHLFLCLFFCLLPFTSIFNIFLINLPPSFVSHVHTILICFASANQLFHTLFPFLFSLKLTPKIHLNILNSILLRFSAILLSNIHNHTMQQIWWQFGRLSPTVLLGTYYHKLLHWPFSPLHPSTSFSIFQCLYTPSCCRYCSTRGLK